nr:MULTISPECIES: ABC transporter permease [unclassified Bradyrhizobium]
MSCNSTAPSSTWKYGEARYRSDEECAETGTPRFRAMAAIGLVFLPGMMTGQILAGVEPADAVKYQLLIMFLIAGGTGLGTLTAVLGGAHLLTDHRHRLRLDRISR